MPKTIESYRTFIAIELPRDIRAHVTEHINRLRHELPEVRASWNREDNLHLTLKFFGDVPVARIPSLSDAVEHATQQILPFDMIVAGCGAFPPRGRPNVLWLGTHASGVLMADGAPNSAIRDSQSENHSSQHPTPDPQHPRVSPSPLATLHSVLEAECAAAGFARDPRPFHPHLTIARLRKPQGSRRLAELHDELGFAPQPFAVSEVVVFRSELLAEGSKHTAISRHELATD